MKNPLPEYEYRFDLVEAKELADCLFWESIRELCRLHEKAVPPPWLPLDAKQRLDAAQKEIIRTHLRQEQSSFLVYPFFDLIPSRFKIKVEGKELMSCEWVQLPRVAVNWEHSDKRVLRVISVQLTRWLAEQRKRNPNARFFSAIGRRGRRQTLLAQLADLAVYRLAECAWSEDEIDKELSLLFKRLQLEAAERVKKADKYPSKKIPVAKVGERNLPHLRSRVKKALKRFLRFRQWNGEYGR